MCVRERENERKAGCRSNSRDEGGPYDLGTKAPLCFSHCQLAPWPAAIVMRLFNHQIKFVASLSTMAGQPFQGEQPDLHVLAGERGIRRRKSG